MVVFAEANGLESRFELEIIPGQGHSMSGLIPYSQGSSGFRVRSVASRLTKRYDVEPLHSEVTRFTIGLRRTVTRLGGKYVPRVLCIFDTIARIIAFPGDRSDTPSE